MKWLLDTHIWLWSLLEPHRLASNITEILQNPQQELYIFPISIWETLILAERNKLKLEPTAPEWIIEALQKSPIQETPLSIEIAIKSRLIKLPHQDPADGFIAATAREYNMTLITADEQLRKTTQIKIL